MNTNSLPTAVNPSPLKWNRRSLIRAGSATLSVAGVLALAGMAGPAGAKSRDGDPAQDAALLNAARELEHEGIAAYQIALGSGLLPSNAAKIARLFQGHHEQHNADLGRAIRRLGGTPVEPKPIDEYVTQLEANKLKTAQDILRLALRLETGAASAYLGLIKPLRNSDLHHLAARLAADEAAHAATFMITLQVPISEKTPLF